MRGVNTVAKRDGIHRGKWIAFCYSLSFFVLVVGVESPASGQRGACRPVSLRQVSGKALRMGKEENTVTIRDGIHRGKGVTIRYPPSFFFSLPLYTLN